VFRLTLILGLWLAVPFALSAQEKEKICRDAETQPLTPGTWASYDWTNNNATSKMRLAVVGQETHAGVTYYWLEAKIENPQRPNETMIIQALLPSLTGDVRTVVLKSGSQPAMRASGQMVQMFTKGQGTNFAAEFVRGCRETELVGWEQVTVPAGSVRAVHLRHVRTGTDTWIQPQQRFPVVKTTTRDAGSMVLTAQGTGAKSSITETPLDMPSLPGASPPR
jgi:hypothetical protein